MNGLWIISAAVHAYVALRLLPGVAQSAGMPWALALGALLLASVTLVPMSLRRHRRRRSAAEQRRDDRLAWASLGLMGLFSSLFVLTVLRDVVLVAAAVVAFVGGPALAPAGVAASAAAVPLAALGVSLIGLWNARRPARVKTVDVPLRDLPPALVGFRIAQISDLHVGPTIKGDYLQRIVETVNALEADVVAVTGDLVDGSVADLGPHVAPLARLRSRHGSFVVTGNHEYYSGAEPWIAELRRLGLTVLMNEHVVLTHPGASGRERAPLVLAGVADWSAHHFEPSHRSDPHRAVAGAPRAAIKVLLAHQPRSAAAAADAGFHLQLSGHTHGGQFLPWNFFVRFQQPFTAGLHALRDLWVYTSRGTGYWGPPKRFGAPSEITQLRLVAG
jgi:predicted MPP superfamily phosphohydrolase